MRYLKIGFVGLLMSAALVSGCGPKPQKRYIDFWKKNDVTHQSAITSEAACRHDALSKVVESSQELNQASIEEKLVSTCMKSQGFHWGRYEI